MQSNVQKIREALEKIWKEVYFYAFDEEKQDFPHLQEAMLEDPPDYKSLRNSFFEIAHLVDAALAEPPRNCDVGTAEEQDARFVKWRYSRPLRSEFGLDALAWAQLPYEEGGAK